MQSPYHESFQPFRPAAPGLPPLVSPSSGRQSRRDNGFFQDFGNVLSPNSSTFRSPYGSSNNIGSLNSFHYPSSTSPIVSPYHEHSNALGFQTFQSPRRQRRSSLPARSDTDFWSDQSMGYNNIQSPSYSWNGNRKRSATFLSPTNTPFRNPMSPYSDNIPQVTFSDPISTTIFSPDEFEEYSPTIDRPPRTPSFSSYHTYELHTYLSIPPFTYSFLTKPETLTRQGYGGLHQYATRPPTSLMILQSPHLPWEIRVGGRSSSINGDKYLTVFEVLTAIYHALRESPTSAEVNILYASSESKKKYNEVLEAYGRRWERENPYRQDFMRKIDWLCGKSVFNGLVSKKSGGMKGKGKPVWTILFRGKDMH